MNKVLLESERFFSLHLISCLQKQTSKNHICQSILGHAMFLTHRLKTLEGNLAKKFRLPRKEIKSVTEVIKELEVLLCKGRLKNLNLYNQAE